MKQAGLPLLIKKTLDRAVALTALTVAAPAIAVAAAAIKVTMPGPVFFTQTRPGLNARPFRIYKMRTMTMDRDAAGNLLPDDVRLTKLGKFLRRASIDELPQLVNVLKGEMSLVGPRPLLTEYLERYSPKHARRHEVLPGITGWTAVRGRNALDWETRLDLDTWYVENWSLLLDLRIVVETVGQVLRREGVERPGHATMPIYMGAGSN